MANIRLIVKNIFDTATLTESPALVSTLPIANVQRQERNKVARTTSTASQDWKASWATAQRMNAIAICKSNFTAAAQQRTRTYTDTAWTTGVVDNAAADCLNITSLSRLDVYTDADFAHMKNSVRYPSLVTNMQSLNLSTTDASNPDGYMQISRIFAGEYFEFRYHVPFGGALVTTRDMGTQARMDGGDLVSDKRPKYRRWELNANFCMGGASGSEWQELLAIQRYCGYDKDLFLDVYPGDDTFLGLYNRALVKFVELNPFDRFFADTAQQRLVLEET